MKKIIYAFALMFLVTSASAEITYSLVVKGGASFGRFKNWSLEGGQKSSVGGQFSSKLGLGGGLYGRIWFNKYFGGEAGVEFNMGGNVQKWQQRNWYGQFRESVVEHKIHYVTLPLVGKVGWGNDRLRAYATVGGYLAIPVHGRVGKIEYLDQQKVSEIRYDADFKNEYSKLDYGIRMGAGFEVIVSKNKHHGVTFDATYDWGLAKVYRKPYYQFTDPDKTKITNSRTLVQVGYVYNFGFNKDKTEKAPKVKEEKTPKVKEEKAPKVKEEKTPKIKEEKAPKVKEEKVKPEKEKKEKSKTMSE